MSKIFTCDVERCGLSFTKKSDLNKHVVEHVDPSRLFRCTETDCTFVTKYKRGLDLHKNTHSGERPFTCPDMVKTVASSNSPDGSSVQPSEVPCNYRSNCSSGLLKHRIRDHGYKPRPSRPRRRAISGCRARASPYSSLPLPPPKTISGTCGTAKSSSAYAHPTVTSPPSSVTQPLNCAIPDTHHSEASNNNPSNLAANPIYANLSVTSQNNFTHHPAPPLAFPTFPNGPAMASSQDAFNYVASNTLAVNDAIHASLGPPNNVKQSRREGQSTDLTPVASFTAANSYNSASTSSYAPFTPSPAGQPFDQRLYSDPATVHYQPSNGNAFTFAQGSTNANSAVASQHDHTNRGVTVLPFPLSPRSVAALTMVAQRFYNMGHNLTHTSPDPFHNATTLPSPKESVRSETESTDWASVASSTSSHSSSSHSSAAFPPSPVEMPSDNDVLINAGSSVAQLNIFADHSVARPAPSPFPVPEPLVDSFSSSEEIDVMPSNFSFETKINEDEIFFRGMGHEGCLCPEMMLSSDVEGWDGSLPDIQEQEYYPYSFT